MAVVYLTGVLEDGTSRDVGIPENPRATLTLSQGVTTQVILRSVTAGGVPLSSADGTLLLTVKKRPGDEPALVQVSGSWSPLLGGPGVAVFTFSATAFSGIEWGRYVYDIRLTNGSTVNRLVPASPLVLQPAV